MKVLFLITSILMLVACNGRAQSDNNPDLTEDIAVTNFEQEFPAFLEQHLTADDVITVETASSGAVTANLYRGIAAFWWEGTGNGTTAAKEICKGKSGVGFARCVKAAVDSGQRVTIWKDQNGNYHASI